MFLKAELHAGTKNMDISWIFLHFMEN